MKAKPRLEGWTRVGDVLVCALCGAEFGAPEPDGADSSRTRAAAGLAALLGEERSSGFRLTPGEEHRRFCRNCRHRIEHPFMLRCGRDGREIDPGGSCVDFELEETK